MSTEKLQKAEIEIFKYIKRKHYAKELQDLKTSNTVKQNSRLISLDPFIDDNGVLPVGGRSSLLQLNLVINIKF